MAYQLIRRKMVSKLREMTEDAKRRTKRSIDQVQDLLQRASELNCPWAEIMEDIPSMSEEDLDRFLIACRIQELHDCEVLAALRYGKLKELLDFKDCILPPVMRFLFQDGLIDSLAAQDWEPSWRRLLKNYSEKQTVQLLQWMSGKSINKQGLTVFQMLLKRCPPHLPCLGTVARSVIRSGLAPQYHLLLQDKKNITPVQDPDALVFHLADLVHNCSKGRSSPEEEEDSPGVTPDYNGCLMAACKAGLFWVSQNRRKRCCFTDFITPMSTAVLSNQPDLVRFIYSTGTVSNREVFQLSRDPRLLERCQNDVKREDAADPEPSPEEFPAVEDGRAAGVIRSFLVDKASQPPSLKSLCLAEAAKRVVGVGQARKAAVKRLEIPRHLQDDLMSNCDRALLKYKSPTSEKLQ